MTQAAFDWPQAPGWIDFTDRRQGRFCLRRVMPARDADLLRQWFCSERGHFWVMPDKSLQAIRRHYARMQRSAHARAFLGVAHDRPAFLIECYDPAHDRLAAHYPVQHGDLGVHLFMAPPVRRIANFSGDAFRFALGFMFERLGARRIVVEPSIDNSRIHALNRRMGFCDGERITLPDKAAILAFCSHADFLTHNPPEPP